MTNSFTKNIYHDDTQEPTQRKRELQIILTVRKSIYTANTQEKELE